MHAFLSHGQANHQMNPPACCWKVWGTLLLHLSHLQIHQLKSLLKAAPVPQGVAQSLCACILRSSCCLASISARHEWHSVLMLFVTPTACTCLRAFLCVNHSHKLGNQPQPQQLTNYGIYTFHVLMLLYHWLLNST